MSAADASLPGWSAAPRTAAAPLLPVFAIALVGTLAFSLPNLADPMIRFDDYPALLARADWFWEKTLHEGRWVNWLWHLRGVVTPAWLNFAVYQALWALLAAALAVAAFPSERGRAAPVGGMVLLALLIAVAPPASMIALWFNTLIPGLALVALYAVLGCRMAPRHHRALLPVFTVVTFMAYTTYPLILLAVCLFATRKRSLRDLAGLLALFTASFAAAVLATYALNWQVHGIFGVPLADWRQAAPATGLSGLVDNLPLLGATFRSLVMASSFGIYPLVVLQATAFVIATLYLARHAPKEALYLHAGLFLSLALCAVQVLKLGVEVPPRSFVFAWIFHAVLVGRAAVFVRSGKDASRLFVAVPVAIVALCMALTFQRFADFRPWQAETRAFAEAHAHLPDPLLVKGDVMALETARRASVQHAIALSFRVLALNGQRMVLCDREAQRCARLEAEAAEGRRPPLSLVALAPVQ
ncbi:hypothetical protein [Oceaniglobus roseus]|uniref:hypothetical protein n=1 Tax=Oceaniglobus roseus TaxID=1737570 RepID=UPI000C7E93FC|nr:hypothetical protein [Kandeliimicrobium roseum]